MINNIKAEKIRDNQNYSENETNFGLKSEKDYTEVNTRQVEEEMNYGHFPPSYGQFPPQYYFPGTWPQNNQDQNHVLSQAMHQHTAAAAAANMYATSSMYADPNSINQYANDAIFNSAGGSGEEECPQCSSKFIRSQGKLDPNNPQNMICQSCFENATSSTATPNVAKSTSSSSSSAVNLYHGGRNLKREKKVKTCPNCKTQTTSLWRKFKSADEVQRELEKKEGGKDREIDTSRPEFEGELGCNPCVLYWKLHGKHRPLELQRDGPLVTRKRKRKEKPFVDKYDPSLMHKQYSPMYWPVHQNNQAGYPFFQSNNFLTNNVYQTSNVLGPSEYPSSSKSLHHPS